MEIVDGIHVLSGGFTNLFLIEDGGEAALVDAYWGTIETDLLQEISKIIDPKDLKMVILTHGHPDHVGACPYLEERTPAFFAAHLGDAWLVEDPASFFTTLYYHGNQTREKYSSMIEWAGGRGVRVRRILRGGDVVRVGSKELEIIHTPGHSDGSICVFDRAERILFSGDTPVPSEWLKELLGIVFDAGRFIDSLQRMLGVDPAVLAQAHGPVRRGIDARRELERHLDHYSLLEGVIQEVMKDDEPLGLQEIRARIVDSILHRDDKWEAENPMNTLAERHTVHAFLQKLCLEGKLYRDDDLMWRKV